MKKLMSAILALALVMGLILPGGAASAADTPSVTVYRLYLEDNKEHLFTTDYNEVKVLTTQHGWTDEGVAWYAPKSGTAVYRLYNAELQNHLYTTDLNEIKVLTTKEGWTMDFDGQPLFFSGGSVPIYRLYNRELRGLHLWSTDTNEYKVLSTRGWTQEGVALYAVSSGIPNSTTQPDTGTQPGDAEHVHQWKTDHSWSIKNGYACNVCLTDVTDWDDKYDCHGGYHTHTWYLEASTDICSGCGAIRHEHEWYWHAPKYNTGTDTVYRAGYYQCAGCGNKSLDGVNIAQDLRTAYWVSGYDFTGTDYILSTYYTEPQSDPMALQNIKVRSDDLISNVVVGDSGQLTVLYTPASTPAKGVTWMSSNTSVMTVDKNGYVRAVGPGTAKITATSTTKGYSDSISFAVTNTREGAIENAWLVIDGQRVENNGSITLKGKYVDGYGYSPHVYEVYVGLNPDPARCQVHYEGMTDEQFSSSSGGFYVAAGGGSSYCGDGNKYITQEDTEYILYAYDRGSCTMNVTVTDAYGKVIKLSVQIIVN